MIKLNTNQEFSLLDLLTEKDKYKNQSEKYSIVLKNILSNFYNIGGPLNDNILGFDNRQRKVLSNIAKEIRTVLD